jgi:RND family efflux transporter MFP subunit
MPNDTIDLSSLRISKAKKEQPVGRRLPWKLILTALALVIVISGGLFLKDQLASVPEVELTTASLLSPSQANAVLTANGYVVAQVKASVASKATGRLERLLVEEGDRVRKGQVVGILENQDVAAARDQAVANLDVARADSFDARQSLERQRTLLASGLTPKAELDAAEARYNRVVATIHASLAAVRAADVALENTRIRAPFNGTVLTKNADVGEVVAPFGAATNSKGAVVTMADMSSLQVEADVSESNITRVTPGQPCEITLDAYPDRRYAGSVYKIVPTADRSKATVLTKVAFKERDDRVLPEMSAKVNFLSPGGAALAGDTPRLMVASSAIVAKDGGWVAFRVVDNRLAIVSVKIGGTSGDRIEILEGLSPGDQVVLKNDPSFAPGTKVKPK